MFTFALKIEVWLDELIMKLPIKKSAIYTKLLSLRIEDELWASLRDAKIRTDVDVQEAMRIKLRELVLELVKAA